MGAGQKIDGDVFPKLYQTLHKTFQQPIRRHKHDSLQVLGSP